MTDRKAPNTSCFPAHAIPGTPAGCHVTISSACPDDLGCEATHLLNGVLDNAERLRIESLKDRGARNQYLVAHALLRVALSAARPVIPSEWRFDQTPSGQPVISQLQRVAPLFFSLSHTKSLAVCAVSSIARVGVDAERIEASLEMAELAPHVLSQDEREWWKREEPQVRLRWFYQLWSLKESFLKAVGLGLQVQPSRLSFRLSDRMSPELRQLPVELGRREEWSFRVFDPTPVHVCALAAGVQPESPLSVSWHCMSVADLVASAHADRPTNDPQDVTPLCSNWKRGLP